MADPFPARTSFLYSDQPLARVARPLARFLHVEAAGGILLVAATVVALVWANSPWHDSYESLWSATVELRIGGYHFTEDLAHFVNDGLMAVFFFVVGLEIKRELVTGELRDRRAAALPAFAALGGMVVPATLYLTFNSTGAGRAGWGIPMATDIAFALGVVALLGRRVPAPLKVFLLTLAIVDDIGAIAVIAVFYTDDLQPQYLVVAAALTLAIVVLRRLRVVYTPVYVTMAVSLWVCVYESGVHATIAGVVLGLLTPAAPIRPAIDTSAVADYLDHHRDWCAEDVRTVSRTLGQSVSPCDRFIDVLHPWTSFVIIPIFALANAGIVITRDSLADPSSVLVGVAVGLVAGKLIGVAGFAWLATRLGLGKLPDGVSWRQMIGAAALAGIGFTVSLFITDLAFVDPILQADAKIGILIASITAAALGAAIILLTGRHRPMSDSSVDDGHRSQSPTVAASTLGARAVPPPAVSADP